MVLSIGARLGPYEILSLLGAGGMGEVYRAKDTRLGREVAVKVLLEGLREDRERLARFEREARSASRLSDPHIVSVFDVGRESDTTFLVTELVDGTDLRAELLSGPLSMERAVELAAQIADGLAAAHDAGIVHRDLKPENVLITRSGIAKIADFGLAKAHEGPTSSSNDSVSTVSSYTSPGTVMGTVDYMAPEQIRGENIDARSDIFSFGTLLYEMLTGRRPFRRAAAAETMASILREEVPELSQAAVSIPAPLDRIVRHCLEKLPERRFQSARDLGFALRSLSLRAEPDARPDAAPEPGVTRSVLPLPPGTRLSGQAAPVLAISRDGTKLAYVALTEAGSPRLFVSHLDKGETQQIPESEYAEGPFFSPDGKWVAFAADVSARSPRSGELRKHSFSSGLTQTVCPLADEYNGAWWAENGDIYFVGDVLQGLRRVPRAGGGRELPAVTMFRVGDSEGPRCIGYPRLLGPGERWALVLDWDASALGDTSLLDLSSGQLRTLAKSASSGIAVRTGHLLYTTTDGTLFAAPFDVSQAPGLTGPAVAVVKDVALDAAGGTFAVSDTGALVFARGQLRGSVYETKHLVSLAFDGEAKPTAFAPDALSPWFCLSGDGRRLIVSSRLTGLWVCDLQRGTRARLPVGMARLARHAVFTPDGDWIAFRGALVGGMGFKIFRQKSDGSAHPEIFFAPDPAERRPRGFIEDGETLLYEMSGGEHQRGLWGVCWRNPQEPVRRIAGLLEESSLSPDGRFVLYQSGEFGSIEIFVQGLAGDARVQVSVGGGRLPRWSRDGRQIFFLAGDRFMAAPFDPAAAEPDCGAPEPLFERSGVEGYEGDPSGKGFIAVERLPDSGLVHQIELVTGWFGELERLVPVSRDGR